MKCFNLPDGWFLNSPRFSSMELHTIRLVVKGTFWSQNTEPRKAPKAQDALPILSCTSNTTLPEASTKETKYLKDILHLLH